MNDSTNSHLVSIIVPTFNRAALLPRCLDSILAQAYRPIELLIVDDGSTDNTFEIVKAWIETLPKDSRFDARYVVQENTGAPAARNNGYRQSRGHFIQWWDSDDWMFPEKLELQVNAMLETRALWSICDEVPFDGGTATLHAAVPPPPYPMRRLSLSDFFERRKTSFITGSLITRREAIAKIGLWDEELSVRQDTDLILRLLVGDFENIYLQIPLYFLLKNRAGITGGDSAQYWRKVRDAWKLIEKKHRHHDFDAYSMSGLVGRVFAECCRILLLDGNRVLAEEAFQESMTRLRGLPKLKAHVYLTYGRCVGFGTITKLKAKLRIRRPLF